MSPAVAGLASVFANCQCDDPLLSKEPEVDTGNRRLIRPSITEVKEQRVRKDGPAPMQKKATPPDQTNAENFYYIKQMQAQATIVDMIAPKQ